MYPPNSALAMFKRFNCYSPFYLLYSMISFMPFYTNPHVINVVHLLIRMSHNEPPAIDPARRCEDILIFSDYLGIVLLFYTECPPESLAEPTQEVAYLPPRIMTPQFAIWRQHKNKIRAEHYYYAGLYLHSHHPGSRLCTSWVRFC